MANGLFLTAGGSVSWAVQLLSTHCQKRAVIAKMCEHCKWQPCNVAKIENLYPNLLWQRTVTFVN